MTHQSKTLNKNTALAARLWVLVLCCVLTAPLSAQHWQRGMFIGGMDDDLPAGGLVPSANNKIVFGGRFGESMLFNGTTYTGHYGTTAKLNYFLTEVDSNGVVNWMKIISQNIGSTGGAYYITYDKSGNIYILYNLSNTVQAQFQDGSLNTISNSGLVLFKFNNSGDIQWFKEFGGNTIQGLSTDKDGNVYIVGYRDSYSGNSITLGDFTFTYTGLENPGFLLKLNSSNGNTQWGKVYNKRSFITGIVVDSTNNLYLKGVSNSLTNNATLDFTDGTPDVVTSLSANHFWIKYKTDGSFQWVKSMPAEFEMKGINKEGTLLVVPQTLNTVMSYTYNGQTINPNNKTIILNALVDSSANFKVFPIVESQRSITVSYGAFNPQGYYFTVGKYAPETAFGDSIVPDAGSNLTDGFVLKYNTDGELLWYRGMEGINSQIVHFLNFSGDYVYTLSYLNAGVVVVGNQEIFSDANMDLQDIFFARLKDCNATLTKIGLVLQANAGSSYQWYRDGAVESGVTTQNYTPTYNGRYQVEVSFPDGCKCKTASLQYNDGITATQDKAVREGIRLFPNPAKDFAQVQAPVEAGFIKLTLLDSQGKEVWKGTMEKETTLPLEGLSSGLYTLMAHSQRGFWQQKISIE